MTDVETIQAIYGAFSRGDLDEVFTHFADDIAWEAWEDNSAQKAGVPWLQPRHGKADVAEFFHVLASLTTYEFRVLSLLEGDHQVAATIVVDHGVPTTGRRFRDEAIHLWTLDVNHRVTSMRHYVDTAKHIHAAAG